MASRTIEQPTAHVLLTERQVAERYQLARSTLAGWRATGRGPRFRKLEGTIRYAESDLLIWEAAA